MPKLICPSILCNHRVVGGEVPEPILKVTGTRQEITQDGVPFHHRACSHTTHIEPCQGLEPWSRRYEATVPTAAPTFCLAKQNNIPAIPVKLPSLSLKCSFTEKCLGWSKPTEGLRVTQTPL